MSTVSLWKQGEINYISQKQTTDLSMLCEIIVIGGLYLGRETLPSVILPGIPDLSC